MKQLLKLFLFLVLTLFMFSNNVKAEECDYARQNELNKVASNVKLNYEVSEEPDLFFTINIFNLTEDIYASVENSKTREVTTYYYSEENKGNIAITSNEIYEKVEFTVEIMPAKESCANNKLRVLTLTTPRYNPYYSSYLCDDIKDYSLCQKWSDFELSFEEFKNRIDAYKLSLKDKKGEEEQKVNKNILEKIRDFMVNYYVYFVISGVVIVSGGVVGIIVIRKKRIL